jgi:hypothetical protein
MTSHDLQQWSGSRFAKGGCTPGDEKKASAIFVGGLLLLGLQLVPLNPRKRLGMLCPRDCP